MASPWGWRLSFYLGGAAMAAGGALWIFGMRALEPVSYTHLDVYKRQRQVR